MNRYLARRQFSYALMNLSSFRSPFPSPVLFSFSSLTVSSFAAITPPVCLQTAQRKQCENLFVQHLPLPLAHPLLPSILTLVTDCYFFFFCFSFLWRFTILLTNSLHLAYGVLFINQLQKCDSVTLT